METTTKDPFPFAITPLWGKAIMWFAILAPLLGVAYAVVTLWGRWVQPVDLALFFGMWTITGLGISLGYHRFLAHKSFKARAPVRLGLLIAAVMSLEGRPSEWAATHIRHHAKSDQKGEDPHSPVEGFVHAHMGWLVNDRIVRKGPVVDELRRDPVVRFVDATWTLWLGLGLFLPALIAGLVTQSWLGALQGFVWGTAVRIFVVHHLTWAVNSVGHILGTRPHATKDRSRNLGLLALLTWGEGWHNNHHAYPRSPFIGLRWWQVDIGGYVLRILRAFGLVSDLWSPRKSPKGQKQATA